MNDYFLMSIMIFSLLFAGALIGFLFRPEIMDLVEDKDNLIYSCNNYFNSAFYNCPVSKQYQNATGYYCDGYLICENLWKGDGE